jgi:hypothetical protein
MKLASLRVQFGIHCRKYHIFFMYILYEGYSQGTIIITSSSVDIFCRKL